MVSTPEQANFDLNRDIFLRQLVRELAGTLEKVVGLEAAEGYISTVGGAIGQWIDREYKDALDVRSLTPEQVGQVCVDLKKRIDGDFFLISADEDKLVFGNRRCPFGEAVKDRPSLCMMTSNVFGRIAADNTGYARVELHETIARGHPGCHVVVHLKPIGDAPTNEREYYRAFDPSLE